MKFGKFEGLSRKLPRIFGELPKEVQRISQIKFEKHSRKFENFPETFRKFPEGDQRTSQGSSEIIITLSIKLSRKVWLFQSVFTAKMRFGFDKTKGFWR